jgi:DNA (cytosine-5)-methyltransferase 1
VELFAGAGGLAMGVSMAGFKHAALIELDHDACETLRHNQRKGVKSLAGGLLFEGDVRGFDFNELEDGIDLVAGGPPCQPFSIGGKHRGHVDERNMFPDTVAAVRKLQPRAFIFENVRGLLRQSFARYFEYIYLQLNYPEITRRRGDGWMDHHGRLERYHTRGNREGLTYNVVFTPINAADFGVPQRRERVFIVGFRSDLQADWSFPKPTHSIEALLWAQWITDAYWENHRIAKRKRPELPERLKLRVDRMRDELFEPETKPWLTVRDAVSDLPDPEKAGVGSGFTNHRFQPGARPYVGHTGSLIDEPAKTLKAGDHGVPGGENMLALPDGDVRYFTVRESARLQTFPDDYEFQGAWSECMRQLGNAVPVTLANVVAESVKKRLERFEDK